jgi:hypothetical protein
MKYSKTQDSVYCAPCRFFGPYMLIVFNSKSSLIHYTFDKIKFLSQLHICIILLYLIFYFSKFMFKSWLVAHENWVSVGSFLVPGKCKNAGFCTIYPRPSVRWGRVSWPSTRLLNRFEYTSFWGSYSTERDMPWSITVIVVMSRRVMGIKNFNSCRWSGGNKTPGVNLVIKCVVLQVN